MNVSELQKIVSSENVLETAEQLETYADSSGIIPPRQPVGAVKPANIQELKEIVKWANTNKVPLVPISSGAPHFRGDTTPGADGAIMVDLSRMNKIIRVNQANRVALVEPGVTFGELQAELARAGLSAYMPLCPRNTKSVLVSALERDPITMPCIHFDSTDPMLCTEMVFGTGDSTRTGEAAGPDTLEKQWEIGKAQISPFGPTQMDPQRLVSGAQGTIGIVTWMSLKCRFLSEVSSAFFVPSPQLDPLVELSYKLTKIRFTGNILILNRLNLACLLRQDAEDIRTVSRNLPEWLMFVSCEGYGPLPEEKVKYLEEDLAELTASLGLVFKANEGGLEAAELAGLLAGPSPEPYWKQRLAGGFFELFFLTTQGKTPEFTRMVANLARQHDYPVESIGMYLQPTVMGTSCHCEFDFYYDPTDAAATEKTRKLVMEVADKTEAAGAFYSRPYRPLVDVAYRRSSDTAEMQKKVKGIFDPNGILNPGHLCFR